MLMELHVSNLATITDLRLEFGKGFTVLSGDEGAGKSLLIDSLCLLSGGKANTGLVRTGTPAAIVEAVFSMDPKDTGLAELLNEAGIACETDGTLVLTREVHEQGKSITRVNRRAVPLSLLKQIGRYLIDIHGQTEHLSVLNPACQTDLLDGYGGLLASRRELGSRIFQFRGKAREMLEITETASKKQRDLLEYQAAEIDSAGIRPGEDEALKQEQVTLQRVQEVKEACYAAYAELYGDDRSASGAIRHAMKALHNAASAAPQLHPRIDVLEAAAVQLEDIAQSLSRYMESLEDSPARAREVEKRLELLHDLKKKYGPALEDVLRSAEQARTELESMDSREELQRKMQAECQKARIEAGILAENLSREREKASAALVKQVNAELGDLGMPYARFDIQLSREAAEDGLPAYRGAYSFSPGGIDRVQFMASTNPGEPLKPLASIASGGETCRFMLALKSALRHADPVPTLVFDEIDAGIGGRNAQTVGRKLASLAGNRQVICVTHLPQIACFAGEHCRVAKEVASGRAVTYVENLSHEERVRELAAMLGDSGGQMLASAQALLKSARKKSPDNADTLDGK